MHKLLVGFFDGVNTQPLVGFCSSLHEIISWICRPVNTQTLVWFLVGSVRKILQRYAENNIRLEEPRWVIETSNKKSKVEIS